MVDELSGGRGTAAGPRSAVAITAVIPTYNRAELLARAIASVLAQSWPPSEIIVVDDGSTDATAGVLGGLTPAVRAVRTARRGAAGARNEGVRQATSEWIAFLDSDDEWTVDHLERISRAIVETHGRATLYFDDTERCEQARTQWEIAGFAFEGAYECLPDGTPWVMAKRHPMTIPASVIRRTEIIDIGGLWTRLEVREDTHLFFRLGLGRPVCAVAGLGARAGADDTTGSRLTDASRAGTYAEATIALYEDLLHAQPQGAVRAELQRRLGEGHWRMSRSQWRAGGYGRATAHAVRSLTSDPLAYPARLRRWVAGRYEPAPSKRSVPTDTGAGGRTRSTDTPTVSVLVVSYRTPDLLRRCLDSIRAAAAVSPIEVVVVDNTSGDDGSADMVAREFPEVTLLAPGVNLGFAKATNLAAEYGQGEYLLLLNPDATLEPTTVAALVDFARSHPNAAIVGAQIVHTDGSVDPRSCAGVPTPWSMLCFGLGITALFAGNRILDPESLGRWQRDSPRAVGYVPGCCLLIARQRWRRLEGFDPRFFMFGEDIDLALRAAEVGWTTMLAPGARVTHQFGASFQRRSDKGVMLYSGKATVIRKQWRRPAAWFGLAMLWAGVGLRAAGSRFSRRLMGSGRGRRDGRINQAVDYWPAVWAERGKWMKGYPSGR